MEWNGIHGVRETRGAPDDLGDSVYTSKLVEETEEKNTIDSGKCLEQK